MVQQKEAGLESEGPRCESLLCNRNPLGDRGPVTPSSLTNLTGLLEDRRTACAALSPWRKSGVKMYINETTKLIARSGEIKEDRSTFPSLKIKPKSNLSAERNKNTVAIKGV